MGTKDLNDKPDQQQNQRENADKESPLDHIFNEENMKAAEEDAEAEQQRKEAMTERD